MRHNVYKDTAKQEGKEDICIGTFFVHTTSKQSSVQVRLPEDAMKKVISIV